LVASFAPSPTNTLTLSPNTIAPPGGLSDPYWYRLDGTGNKNMEANLYVESNGGALGGQTVTFTGTVAANSLTPAHTAIAFIKDFAPDYSSFVETTVPLTPGFFSISLATLNDPARHVQYGFQMKGENVWITNVGPFGSVSINTTDIPPGNPNVVVDPAKNWLGYVNVYELDGTTPAGLNDEWLPADLKAVFSGLTLTLSPYVNPTAALDDPFWYFEDDGIKGNRVLDANMYVQPQNGTLSGQTVNFSGVVESNTLTPGHTAIAFIKEYTSNFSSLINVETAPLTPGPFNISLPISTDPTRVVQYGFQMIGPNVVPGEEGSFGSVVITSTSFTTPYQTWIRSYNFLDFTNPDLTQTGDPEGDGKTNIEEFALNDNPTSGVSSGKVRSRVETVGADQALVLTLPVRGAPVFGGSPSKTATADQVVYTIEGSNNLGAFDQGVTEVTPASVDGLPATDSGWSYRSFRLDGAIGGGTPRGPQGFLRAGIAPAP
jgi:hypothetical protein